MTRVAVTVTVEYERPGVLDWTPPEVAKVIECAVRERLPHLNPTFDLAFPEVTA